MILYIEYVLLDNIVIDYILIKFLEITFKEKYKKLNKFFACSIGAFMTLLLPFIMGQKILLVLYKISTAIIFVLLLKKYKSFRKFITYLILFIAYTFLIGGACLGIISILGINYTMSGVLVYSFEFPISIFILIFAGVLFLLKKIILILKNQLKITNYLYDIKLIDGNNETSGIGFFDSGNNVKSDGQGVNIISLNLFMKLYKEISIEKIILKNIDVKNLKNVKYIHIGSLSKSQEYLSFTIDKLFINKKICENAVMAVALKNFDNFDCILHSDCVGGEK